MSKGPKISIITACYNAEQTIEQTIQSVLNQTYDNIEYIIVDGASTDGTMDIVSKYRDRIDVIISEPDKGIYDAFNKGAKVASGEYIQYLNSDDYLYDNEVIFDVKKTIKLNNYPILLYGGIKIIDEDTQYINISNSERKEEELLSGKMIPHPATFIRRNILSEVGYFNDKYKIVADYDLILKVYKKYPGSFVYFPRMISVFRLGGMSSFIGNMELLQLEMESITPNILGSSIKQVSNEDYLKIWLEKKLFKSSSIAEPLLNTDIKNIVIWGTGRISNMMIPEFVNSNINIKALIDNNQQNQNFKMNGIEIVSADWLKKHINSVDAIIFGFEGFHEEAVSEQIIGLNLTKKVPLYSWRNLLLL